MDAKPRGPRGKQSSTPRHTGGAARATPSLSSPRSPAGEPRASRCTARPACRWQRSSLCRERWPGRVSHSLPGAALTVASRGLGTQPTAARSPVAAQLPGPPSARAPGGERVKRTHSTVMSPHLGSPEESLSLLAVAAGSPSPSAGAALSRLSASGAGDPPAGPSSTPAPRTGHLGLAGAALRSSTRSLPSGRGA